MTGPLRAFGLLLKWQYLRLRRDLPVIVLIQVALAMGVVYGLALLFPRIDSTSALFLATGAPTMTLLILGLTVVPQEVSQARLTGRLAYVASLPVPRLAPPAAELAFWLLAQAPGTALSLVVASLRFRFALDVHVAVVPVILFVALTGASVGYALAMLVRPALAQQLSSFVSIGILLFSPINFPVERLPGAVRMIHQVLPVKYMADLMRWSLTGRFVPRPGLALLMVSAWCAAGVVACWRLSLRRG